MTIAPYEIVLNLALNIALPLAAVLAVTLFIFFWYLMRVSQTITRPLLMLGEASRSIASGSLDTEISIDGEDEIGQLGNAFAQMQNALNERVGELSLLLSVSQLAANSLDLRQALPPILQGAIRATAASSARIVVFGGPGSGPILFAEGASMPAPYDRILTTVARRDGEFRRSSRHGVAELLNLGPEETPPLRAILGMPLISGRGFHGVFWLGFREPHRFEDREIDLIRTLAGQASVLVDNGLLYASSEGGRRRLLAVLASTTDAVIVTEQSNRVLLINPAAERLLGVRSNVASGRALNKVVPSKPLLKAIATNGDSQQNLEVSVGDSTWSANISTIIGNDGQVYGRVTVLHDVTALKEIDELKSEFVQTVSHDLRSPLTYMRGYATMMPMMGSLSPKQAEYIDKILIGIDQMETLVSTVLDLGRIEAGVDLSRETVDLNQLLRGILADNEQLCEEAGLHLKLRIAGKLPPITGDPELLRRAIVNYITNAIKYAPNSGDLIIRAGTKPASNGSKPMVVICVEDKGPGIPPKDVTQVFDKFYRSRNRDTDKVKGTGLGLAIVHSIAQRHGGTAWCESQLGRGSRFFIALPIH